MITSYIYGAIAALILGLCVATTVTVKQRDAARRELIEYQAAAAAVIQERLAAQEEQRLANARKATEVSNEYKARIAELDKKLSASRASADAAAKRLRDALARDNAPALPGVADPAGGADGGPDRDTLLAELAGCLKNAEKLKALQDWIRRTH